MTATTPNEADVAALAEWLMALPGHTISNPESARVYFRAAARGRLQRRNDLFVRDWRSSLAEPLVLAAD
jgi:hypothetical protein